LGEAEVGRNPAVASPNSGAGFARAVGGDGGQGGPIFDDQEEIGCRPAHHRPTAQALHDPSPETPANDRRRDGGLQPQPRPSRREGSTFALRARARAAARRRQTRPARRSLGGGGDRAPPARHAQLEPDHRAGGDPASAPRARPDVGAPIGMEPGPSSGGCGCGAPSTGRIER